jgi:hypothetical protein
MNVDLNADGPHSGEYSREVAEAMAEAARVLCHATIGSAPGLDYASDADSVTGFMASTAARLGQLSEQLSGHLGWMHGHGRLGDDDGQDVSGRVDAARDAYSEAGRLAAQLSRALSRAQSATSHMQTLGPDGQ